MSVALRVAVCCGVCALSILLTFRCCIEKASIAKVKHLHVRLCVALRVALCVALPVALYLVQYVALRVAVCSSVRALSMLLKFVFAFVKVSIANVKYLHVQVCAALCCPVYTLSVLLTFGLCLRKGVHCKCFTHSIWHQEEMLHQRHKLAAIH